MRALASPLIIATALLTVAAIPPSESGRAALARFQSLDSNHDGGVAWTELDARGHAYAADSLFLLLDADGDGRLSLKEVEGKGGGGRVARFDAYDVDKNGTVTRREFPAFADRLLFEALDRDRDRRLSLAELRPAFAGSHVRREPEPFSSPQLAAPPPPRPSPCWIPSARAWRFDLEVPVTGGDCRIR
jgi:hypothetical protein